VRATRLCAALAVAGLLAGPAQASEAISDTNLRTVTLAVNAKGEALLTYTRASGAPRRVLAWGAVDALPPTSGVPQTRFKWDYAGGWKKYRNGKYWQTFENACRPYTGPALVYVVAACTAPDGTHWAVQAWQRRLPLLGFAPWLPSQTAFEYHVSHFAGDLAQLAVGTHWTYGTSAVGIFGRLTFRGQPVHGLSVTPRGNPRDRYGRNVYIDTFNSAYGPDWARESGILLHRGSGTFCHSFVSQKPFAHYPDQTPRPAAPGERYRVTVMGPGVTPIVQWEGPGLPRWNGTPEHHDAQAKSRELWDALMTGDAHCAPERS
jgi:hypothetical protein